MNNGENKIEKEGHKGWKRTNRQKKFSRMKERRK